MNLRDDLLQASKLHFKAQIEKHRINVENMLNSEIDVLNAPSFAVAQGLALRVLGEKPREI